VQSAVMGFPHDGLAMPFYESVRAVLLEVGRALEALLERLAVIEHECNHERQQTRSGEQRQVMLVRRLLNCEPVSSAELSELRYSFDAWHVGMIATGPSAREAVESLKADRQLLAVPLGEETVSAWLGWRRRPANDDLDRLRPEGESAAVSLGVGEPASGLEGYRRTYQQARDALQVALLSSQSHARYADIASLAPWLQDPDRGRALVEVYLSPLESQKDGGAVLRETLRVYFAAAHNVSAAARRLGIDRRTLANRMDMIENLLGFRPDARQAELDIALRLHELLERHEMHIAVQNSPLRFPTLA
jgi:PucR C-terminal helix-turn-helix domain/GGDEF-like domain